MAAPLQGLKVVELARVLAGPWIGQTLSDLGAEVIKVESQAGDDTRAWGPPFVGDTAAYFHAANRGKRGITADFREPADLDRVKALIADADIVVENFKTGGLKKYGLDYDTLSANQPGLIYCSVTGFGHTGPYAHRAGYDFLVQGMSGVMDVTGMADGPPVKMGMAFADIFAGLYGLIGIQAALLERANSGHGQAIDISLFDCMVGVMANQAQSQLLGHDVTRMGNTHPSIVPYQEFPCADGHLIIACGNSNQFRHLCEVLEREDLAQNPDYNDNPDRTRNRDVLAAELTKSLSTWARDDILAALEAKGVPAAPINTMKQALEDPQIQARGMIVDNDGVPGLRTPITFSRSELDLTRGAPGLGEDNDAI